MILLTEQLSKTIICFIYILFGLILAWNCIDRKGIPPGPGQGENPYYLYGLSFLVAFCLVWNLLKTV